MKRDTLRRLVTLGAVFLLTLVFGFGIYYSTSNYVVVDGHFYPRKLEVLDLRDQELSESAYLSLSRRLPNTRILWNAPFQNGVYDSTIQNLTVFTLDETDAQKLAYFPDLKTLDGRGCSGYAVLAAYQMANPSVSVLYAVPLGEKSYDQNTREVTLSAPDAQTLASLDYLTKLETVTIEDYGDYAALAALQQSHPNWAVHYTVPLGDRAYDEDAKNLTVYYADEAQLTAGLPGLTKLEVLNLMQPNMTGQALQALKADYPRIAIHYQLTLYGQNLADTETEVDFSGNTMTVEQAEAAADYFPNLEKLILSDCGISDEDMAAFRDRAAERYQVVWTVHFTKKLSARTDDTTFMPVRSGEYYLQDQNNIQALAYCRDMVCIDLSGAAVKDLSWITALPKLRYLNLSRTNITDIGALSGCKNLVWLDLSDTPLADYSPLTGCTGLQDLNISGTLGTSAPIREMTWLKNLWWLGGSGYVRSLLEKAIPNTHLCFNAQGGAWAELPNTKTQQRMLLENS